VSLRENEMTYVVLLELVKVVDQVAYRSVKIIVDELSFLSTGVRIIVNRMMPSVEYTGYVDN